MTSRTLKLIEGSSLGLYKLLPSLPGLPSGSSLCSLDLPLSRDVFSKTKNQGYVCMNCQGGREGVGGRMGRATLGFDFKRLPQPSCRALWTWRTPSRHRNVECFKWHFRILIRA